MRRSKKTGSPARATAPVSRRELVTVAVAVDVNRWVREEAQARGWRLVHLWYWGYALPEGVVPRGALVKNLPDDEHVQALLGQGCPVVRLGNLPHSDDALVPAVLPDHAAEGALAAEHFFERGFHHVGYFGRDPWGDSQLLYEGFREQADARGMACHLHRIKRRRGEPRDTWEVRKRHEFVQWLRDVPKPFGLLASGDFLAAEHCVWALHDGLNVPDDVAILSRGNNLDICESSMPTISSLDLDDEGQYRAACDLLDRLMAGESAPTQPIVIPPKGIVERESTNVRATPDRAVAAALRYMWDHLDLDLSVENIAAEVDMSSRQLARRFQQALGRTVTAEVRRKRLAEVKHLLRATDLSIADIAPMVGFHSTVYLHRAFRAAFGITPAQYRRAR